MIEVARRESRSRDANGEKGVSRERDFGRETETLRERSDEYAIVLGHTIVIGGLMVMVSTCELMGF